jgi:hypothetical protein
MVQSSAGGRDSVDLVPRAFAYIQQVNAARNDSRINVRVRRSTVFVVFIGLYSTKAVVHFCLLPYMDLRKTLANPSLQPYTSPSVLDNLRFGVAVLNRAQGNLMNIILLTILALERPLRAKSHLPAPFPTLKLSKHCASGAVELVTSLVNLDRVWKVRCLLRQNLERARSTRWVHAIAVRQARNIPVTPGRFVQ